MNGMEVTEVMPSGKIGRRAFYDACTEEDGTISLHEVPSRLQRQAFLESEDALRQFYRRLIDDGIMTSAEAATAMRSAHGLTKAATNGERNGRIAWTPGA